MLIVQRKNMPHITRTVNICSPTECKSFVQDVVRLAGAIDHIFNCPSICPGIITPSLFFIPWDTWGDLVAYLKGVFGITHACIPYLKPGASFVNTLQGKTFDPAFPFYCTSITGFSSTMASLLRPKGIRTNVVRFQDIEANPPTEQFIERPRSVSAFDVAKIVYDLMEGEKQKLNGKVVSV